MPMILQPDNVTHSVTIDSPSLRYRSGFAVPNLLAAAHFGGAAKRMEIEHENEPLGPFWDEIRWNVVAAIVMSATALEANFNEHMLEKDFLANLEGEAQEAAKGLLSKTTLLERYQAARQLAVGTKFDLGAEPYQSIYTLVRVRNALVHFEPEWQDEQVAHRKIGALLSGRFKLSPFFPKSSPVFPDRCMGAGFAEWTVLNTLKFIQAFHEACGTKCKYTDENIKTIFAELEGCA